MGCVEVGWSAPLRPFGGRLPYKKNETIWHTNHRHHVTAEQYSTTEHWNSYFKFSIVRNPWAKELSDYFFCIKKTGFNGTLTKYLKEQDFDNIKQKKRHKLWHSNQLDWLISKNNKIELDFIGRIENLQEDFNVVCDKIGIPRRKLPHKNKTNHKHYTEYYDDETREIVAEKYAKDIEYFGYEY